MKRGWRGSLPGNDRGKGNWIWAKLKSNRRRSRESACRTPVFGPRSFGTALEVLFLSAEL